MLPITHFDVFQKTNPHFCQDIYQEAQEMMGRNDIVNSMLAVKLTDIEKKELDRYHGTQIKNIAKSLSVSEDIAKETYWEGIRENPEWAEAGRLARYDIQNLYYVALNFFLFKRKVFRFTEGLTQLLLNTEANASSNILKPPFPSCMFVFTGKEMIDAFCSTAPEFSCSEEERKNAVLSIYINQLGLEEGGIVSTGLHISSHLTVNGQWKLYSTRMLHFGEHDTLEVALNSNLSDYLAELKGLTKTPYDMQAVEPYYRTILNSLLYLNSSAPELEEHFSRHPQIRAEAKRCKSPKNKDKKLQRLTKESSLDYTLAGATVRPIYIDKSKVADSGERVADSSSGRKIAYQFVVRGHWRNQAYGEGLSKRKLIWIKPFIKGQDMAEIAQDRAYIVR